LPAAFLGQPFVMTHFASETWEVQATHSGNGNGVTLYDITPPVVHDEVQRIGGGQADVRGSIRLSVRLLRRRACTQARYPVRFVSGAFQFMGNVAE